MTVSELSKDSSFSVLSHTFSSISSMLLSYSKISFEIDSLYIILDSSFSKDFPFNLLLDIAVKGFLFSSIRYTS